VPSLDFKGKSFTYTHHLSVPYRELLVVPEKSCVAEGRQPDLDDNLIIHGDNLGALKALLPRYAGKVDCIFIDPPYNTGGDWSYSDKVAAPLMKEWLKESANPVDREDLERHEKWLCMMWPRLQLMKELLCDAGILAVAIDDNEITNLGCLLDEIFGEEQRVAIAPWKSDPSGGKQKSGLRIGHEYIVIYHKSDPSKVAKEETALDTHAHSDSKGTYFKGRELLKWGAGSHRSDRETMWFPLTAPDKTEVWPIRNDGKQGRWRMGAMNKYMKAVAADPDEAHWEKRPFDAGVQSAGQSERWVPYAKVRSDSKQSVFGSWLDEHGTNADGTEELKRIFGFKVFDTPKPVALFEWLIGLCPNDDAIVLDSFAGSGTTGHAVMKRNADDGGTRKFILIQLPEVVKAESEAGVRGFRDIVDITTERILRVVRGYSFTGTSETELHPSEKVTWTTFSKDKTRNEILERIEGIETLERVNYDKIEKKITEGVLTIVGQKQVTEKMPGLGGSFTYLELGEAMDLERLLAETPGALPSFSALARYLFFTSTGHTLPVTDTVHPKPDAKGKKKPKTNPVRELPLTDAPLLIGETPVWRIYLHYRPDEIWLRSPAAAITRTQAEAVAADNEGTGKHALVFAAAKFINHRSLRELRVDFAQLPYALHRVQVE
jgi:adenine-specific DNA-methyltransferase